MTLASFLKGDVSLFDEALERVALGVAGASDRAPYSRALSPSSPLASSARLIWRLRSSARIHARRGSGVGDRR